uniref:Uncharacterized protein n=1 Tax=Lygus hesperus TaxID=30085 RepID=A0A0A9VXF3_LYGHE
MDSTGVDKSDSKNDYVPEFAEQDAVKLDTEGTPGREVRMKASGGGNSKDIKLRRRNSNSSIGSNSSSSSASTKISARKVGKRQEAEEVNATSGTADKASSEVVTCEAATAQHEQIDLTPVEASSFDQRLCHALTTFMQT